MTALERRQHVARALRGDSPPPQSDDTLQPLAARHTRPVTSHIVGVDVSARVARRRAELERSAAEVATDELDSALGGLDEDSAAEGRTQREETTREHGMAERSQGMRRDELWRRNVRRWLVDVPCPPFGAGSLPTKLHIHNRAINRLDALERNRNPESASDRRAATAAAAAGATATAASQPAQGSAVAAIHRQAAQRPGGGRFTDPLATVAQGAQGGQGVRQERTWSQLEEARLQRWRDAHLSSMSEGDKISLLVREYHGIDTLGKPPPPPPRPKDPSGTLLVHDARIREAQQLTAALMAKPKWTKAKWTQVKKRPKPLRLSAKR